MCKKKKQQIAEIYSVAAGFFVAKNLNFAAVFCVLIVATRFIGQLLESK